MNEPNISYADEKKDAIGDWIVRGGVVLFFLNFGAEKFSSDPGSHWVVLFHQIGAGDWFRYATGAVEIGAAILVMIPRTAHVGLALLCATMLSASAILFFVLRQHGESAFPGIIFAILALIAFFRREHKTSTAVSK